MNYCRKCHILFEDDRCPRCGNRYVYRPEADDFCFLTEKEFLWAEILEQALKEEGIPVVTDETVVGAWKSKVIDTLGTRHRIFVPFAYLDRAREIEREMFDGNGELIGGEFIDFETEDLT